MDHLLVALPGLTEGTCKNIVFFLQAVTAVKDPLREAVLSQEGRGSNDPPAGPFAGFGLDAIHGQVRVIAQRMLLQPCGRPTRAHGVKGGPEPGTSLLK